MTAIHRRVKRVQSRRGGHLVAQFPESQRLYAAMVMQAREDAQSPNQKLRMEARRWLSGFHPADCALTYAECQAALEPISKPRPTFHFSSRTERQVSKVEPTLELDPA